MDPPPLDEEPLLIEPPGRVRFFQLASRSSQSGRLWPAMAVCCPAAIATSTPVPASHTRFIISRCMAMMSGGTSASFSAVSQASASSWLLGTTRLTRPMRSAVWASTRRAPRIMSLAHATETNW